MNPEVIAKAKEQTGKEPITDRPADRIAPEWDNLQAEAEKVEGFNGSEEDVLTYAMFPKVAPGFFGTRPEGPKNVGQDPAEIEAEKAAKSGDTGTGPVRGPIKYEITLNGHKHSVAVKPA